MSCATGLFPRSSKPTMTEPSEFPHRVSLVIEDQRWEDIQLEDIAAEAINSTLRVYDANLIPCEIHLLATNDETIQQLNSRFRNKNKPTNVLSWQSGELFFPDTLEDEENYRFLGDIAVSYDTLLAESKSFGLTLDSHLSHLLVHSTLHLVGFTHDLKHDEMKMESLETKILSSMGIADPYNSTQIYV
ncbi:MAG: rRNA maturation RNase YbeY [Rhodobacteraceae bacterium]|nr:rRNA maturation RNase YbeY [Paracoccaceae bacterium]MYJ87906.1 rRNA maturation RNase YbeY [Paracoccaceae bacterium]